MTTEHNNNYYNLNEKTAIVTEDSTNYAMADSAYKGLSKLVSEGYAQKAPIITDQSVYADGGLRSI